MAVGASAEARSSAARQASGFRYLIEGNIGHDGRRFDIHLRLLDAATGDQVWSTRHALQETDLSADFSPKLIGLIYRLRSAVFDAETRRVVGQPLSRLTAPELVLYSRAVHAKDQSLSGVREALKIVDDALRLDPNYAPAWVTKASLVNMEGDVDPDQDRDRIGREQDAYTARAVALDSTDSTAWNMRATALAYLARWDGALEAASKAIMIEPHDLENRLTLAWIKGLMGQPDEALVIVDEVLKIDSERLIGNAMRTACEAHVLAGHASAAVTACEKSAVLYGDWITTVYLVAAYANNGDVAKAKAAKDELLRVVPGYTIAQLRAKRYSDHPDYLVLAEKNWYSGLRKAGIPEK
jgi:tetratricopeptide (TPR) repeat protein